MVAEEVNPAVDIWYQRECSLVKVGSIDEGVETSAASKMAEGALPLHVNMYLREHFP